MVGSICGVVSRGVLSCGSAVTWATSCRGRPIRAIAATKDRSIGGARLDENEFQVNCAPTVRANRERVNRNYRVKHPRDRTGFAHSLDRSEPSSLRSRKELMGVWKW